MQTQPLEFIDFSGGQTDYYIDAPLNKFQEGDNFLIFKYGNFGRLFTRPGSLIWDEDNPQIPAGNQRVGTLKYFEDVLLVHSARKLYYVDGTFQTLQGPSGNDLFPSTVTTANYTDMTELQKHVLITSDGFTKTQKVYRDGSNALQLRTAGLPAFASTPIFSPTAGANNYIYRLHYKYTYMVGTIEYVDLGPTVEVEVLNADAPNTNQIAISAIAAIVNGTDHNYDTANIKIEIARTINNGQEFYYAGEITNGTTTFNDTMSDATLQNQEPIYTFDGSVEHEEPPLCKALHAVEDRCYFGHAKVGTEVFKNRVYQSIPGTVDGVPGDFFTETLFDVVGISSHRGIPIVGCTRGVYRIEGQFDAAGNGGMVARPINDRASCVSPASMVQTPVGVFWAGYDGFYWSDGYQSFRVSEDWDTSYALITGPGSDKWGKIQGRYDRWKNRVYWCCGDSQDDAENNMLYILDLNFVQPSKNMPFTSWSGNSFAPSAIEFIDKELIRGDKRGYLLIHRESIYEDPKIDTSLAVDDWTTEAIIYRYKGPATNFGSSFARKFVPWMSIVAQSDANLTLQIISNNDKDRVIGELKPIVARPNLVWGDRDIIWGDPRIVWGGTGLIQQKRRFPKGGFRCNYKQIELTNAFVEIYNSDGYGLGDIDSTLKTVTLSSDVWPVNPIDYYIAFASDGFEREFLITNRTDTVLTYADPSNFSGDATDSEWVIRGYPRGEVLFLIGYVIHFASFSKSFEPFRQESLVDVTDD